jgi:excisionase family DNA binding protein
MSVHLTVAQIAERLGIAPGKILTWISTGELAAIDTSASRNQRPRWRIDPADLEIFLASRRSAPPVKAAA